MNAIQEKIRKLLALSNSSNEFEARDALLKAQELMAKYNMEVNGETDNHEIINDYVKTNLRMVRNHGILAGVIAHNFRTIAYFRGAEIHFLGYKDDVYASVKCLEYALEQIKQGVTKYIERVLQENNRRKTDIEILRLRRQWINGFIKGLHDAFREQAKDMGYEIMLVVPEEVKKEFSHIHTIPSRESAYSYKDNPDAYHDGYQNGKRAMNSNYSMRYNYLVDKRLFSF